MKTKNRLVALITILLVSMAVQAQTVDTKASSIKWIGKKVTGEHYGTIALKSGSLKVADDKITEGTFVIDMNSITCDDLEDAEYNKKLVGHLKSDDFFGTSSYPEAKLVITGSSAFKKGKAEVKANLTIKGQTHPIVFTAQKTSTGYFANIIVDRSEYNVTYGSGSFFDGLGDKMIYDEFTLEVKLVVK